MITESDVRKEEWKIKSGKRAAFILKGLFIFGFGFNLMLLAFMSEEGTDPNHRAVILMGTFALWIGWISITGLVMYLLRNKIKKKIDMKPDKWVLKFVLFAVFLLLLEEIFTVTATNLYWLFGGEYGKAFITGSDNYFEVVLLHSAIVIWPAYLFWAWWLKKYDFHPNWVMLLYGLSGVYNEFTYGGINAIYAIGMWVFVYGLIIYLPAYCIPENRGAKRPKAIHYILTLILPILFQLPFILGVLTFRNAIGHTFPFVHD